MSVKGKMQDMWSKTNPRRCGIEVRSILPSGEIPRYGDLRCLGIANVDFPPGGCFD